jgi:hypothetical protein
MAYNWRCFRERSLCFVSRKIVTAAILSVPQRRFQQVSDESLELLYRGAYSRESLQKGRLEGVEEARRTNITESPPASDEVADFRFDGRLAAGGLETEIQRSPFSGQPLAIGLKCLLIERISSGLSANSHRSGTRRTHSVRSHSRALSNAAHAPAVMATAASPTTSGVPVRRSGMNAG